MVAKIGWTRVFRVFLDDSVGGPKPRIVYRPLLSSLLTVPGATSETVFSVRGQEFKELKDSRIWLRAPESALLLIVEATSAGLKELSRPRR